MKKRVCFITGSRAEYGLQYQIIKKIKLNKFLELKLIVTSMHLESQFGNTYKEIEADGFKIDGKIKIVSQNDTIKGVVSSFSNAVAKISSSIKKIRPDIIVLLGDRYEIFAASCAAMLPTKSAEQWQQVVLHYAAVQIQEREPARRLLHHDTQDCS